MTIDFMRLKQASESLQSSIMLGQAWKPALDLLAAAAGAKAALITRSTRNRIYAVATPLLEQSQRDVLTGKTPPYTSNILILSPTDTGFVSDADPKKQAKLDRIPFFRDYVRPVIDVPFRASAALAGPRDISGVKLAFLRGAKQGGFDDEEVRHLDRILPSIRAAAGFAQYGFIQRAEEQALIFRKRGEFVFKIDFNGRPLHDDCALIAAHGDPLTISRGRLTSPMSTEKEHLDAAIQKAIGAGHQSSTISLTRRSDAARVFLLLLPICGEAGDVLAPASAIGVLIDPARKTLPRMIAIERLRAAIGLTDRESEVAALIAGGISPCDIAVRIKIGEGTVRNHLKSVMQKAEVHSQIELAALVARFQ